MARVFCIHWCDLPLVSNKDNLILKSVKWFRSSGPIMFVARVFQMQLLQVLVVCMLPWHQP